MNVNEAFERIPLLASLNEKEQGWLKTYAHVRSLARGQRIFGEGQATGEYIFVVRGRMKLVKSLPDGREAIVDLVEPGNILCANAPSAFRPYCCSAVALEDDTELLVLPRRDVLSLLESSPDAARAFIRASACRGIETCERLQHLSSGQAASKIANLMLTLARRAGVERNENTIRLPVPLTRQEIADLCAITVETATRLMSRMGREKIVSTAAHGFLIEDLLGLEDIAHGRRALAP